MGCTFGSVWRVTRTEVEMDAIGAAAFIDDVPSEVSSSSSPSLLSPNFYSTATSCSTMEPITRGQLRSYAIQMMGQQ